MNTALLDITKNESVGFEEIQAPKTTEFSGKKCITLDADNPKLFLSLVSDMKEERFDGDNYNLTIEYYDDKKGYMNIICDNKTVDTVYFTGSNEFKSIAVNIKDLHYNNKCDYDFCLSASARSVGASISECPLLISKVSVERNRQANPVIPTYKIDQPGNTFCYYEDEKIINITLDNVSKNDIGATAKFVITDFDGTVAAEFTDTVSLKAGEVIEKELDIGFIKKCDLYTLKAEIADSEFTLCEFAIIKADEKGTLNRDVLLCSHFDFWMNNDRTNEGMELIKRANVGGVRLEFRWDRLEREKGVYDLEKDPTYYPYKVALSKNLEILALLDYGNILYDMPRHTYMPTTDEQIKGWLDYVNFIATTFKGKITKYEVWNEPNQTGFNLSREPGDVYAKLVNSTTRLLHEIDPKNRVSAFCLTYLGLQAENDRTRLPKVYFKEAVDTGLCGEVDAIAIHPYGGINSLEKREMKDITFWYRDEFEKKYGKKIPLWNTEMGYSASQVYPEDKVGSFNSRSSIYMKSRNACEFNCYYNFERKGTIKYDREDMFGMVWGAREEHIRFGRNFIPTRSFLILAGHNYCMAETENDGIFDSPDGNLRLTRFTSKKFGSKVLCVNTVKDTENAKLNLGCEKIEYYDFLGNNHTITSENGIFEITASENPIYLIGDITKTEIV